MGPMSLLVDVSRHLAPSPKVGHFVRNSMSLMPQLTFFPFILQVCVSTRVKKEVLTKGFDSHPSLFFSSLVVFKIFSHLLVYCHNRLIPFSDEDPHTTSFFSPSFSPSHGFYVLKDFFSSFTRSVHSR